MAQIFLLLNDRDIRFDILARLDKIIMQLDGEFTDKSVSGRAVVAAFAYSLSGGRSPLVARRDFKIECLAVRKCDTFRGSCCRFGKADL